ncbi:MAG TPA: carbohydrate ABC transporter permease [Anaerolineales bacterium]|nr:carbohydrate ABC transporter permease [Anaerolineales bacterium]
MSDADTAHESYLLAPRGWALLTRYALLTVVALLFVVPLAWMAASSLKPEYQIFASPPVWWPSPPRWENYVEALTQLPFARFAANTLIIAVGSIVGHLLSCTIVAYGFARLRAPGKGYLFVVLLSTLMLPYPVTMVPLFIIFSRIGWINTFAPLIIPTFFGNAFYIFLLRQAFKQIPLELEDAARLDGATTLDVLRYVILPLSLPALAAVAIFSFQSSWNDFLGPLIFLQDQSRYTLMLGLSFFRGTTQINWAYLMAASLVTVIPVVVVYFVAQRLFIEGIAFTGLKQ